MLFLIFHLCYCTHRGICGQFGSASQWYLSAPPIKIKWMNHAHRLRLRHGCLWLPSNFTTCFPVSAKFDRGANTSRDTKFSQVLENRHPRRRNWQCNCRKGSRTSSALTRAEYTLQTQGNHVSQDLQLIEILDSVAKCVPVWVEGGVPCAFFPMGAWPSGFGSHFPFPEVPYSVQGWKMWKCLLLLKGISTCLLVWFRGSSRWNWTCIPSSSYLHVTWLVLLPTLDQQDFKFRLFLHKSRIHCTITRSQSFTLTQSHLKWAKKWKMLL